MVLVSSPFFGRTNRLLTSYMLDDFIVNQDIDPAGDHDAAEDRPLLRWRDLPDQEDGFSALLTRILEHSCHPSNRMSAGRDDAGDAPLPGVGVLFTEDDYPLWRVRCRVSLKDDCLKRSRNL